MNPEKIKNLYKAQIKMATKIMKIPFEIEGKIQNKILTPESHFRLNSQMKSKMGEKNGFWKRNAKTLVEPLF